MTAFLDRQQKMGALQRYTPPFADIGDKEERCILVRSDVFREIDLERSRLDRNKLLSLHKQMSAFVRGDRLTISVPDDRSGRDGDMKCLDNKYGYIWEMRFRNPTGYRLIGLMPHKDLFMGMFLHPRSNINWGAVSNRVDDVWNSMNGQDKPNPIGASDPSKAFSNWRFSS